MNNDCCVDFQDFLDEHLESSEAKKRYEFTKKLFNFEVKFNKELQNAGIEGYRVVVLEDEDDY
jgi:hypothetical protein